MQFNKLCILLSALWCLGATAEPLSGDLPSAQTWQLGAFSVTWANGELSAKRGGGPILWATNRGEAWIHAEVGKEKVTGSRGSFNIQDVVSDVAKSQTVTAFDFEQSRKTLTVIGILKSSSRAVRYRFTMQERSPHELALKLSIDRQTGFNRVNLHYASDQDEKVFGFGANFSYFNVKGRSFPIWAQEQGHGRGVFPLTQILNAVGGGSGGNWATTYTAVPLYMSTSRKAVYVEDTTYMIFNFENPHTTEVKNFSDELTLVLIGDDSPLKLIEIYTRYTGRMQPLPTWAHDGAIIGTAGGSQRVRGMVELLKKYNVPVSAYFLQDWVGQRRTPFGPRLWWNWEADPVLYEDWPTFVGELQSQGYKVLSYVNPFLTDAADKPGKVRNLFREASEKNFLVNDKTGKPYPIGSGGFTASLVDFSNPDARVWFKSMLADQLVSTGVDGWMADFGEALPYDAATFSGDASAFHNRYIEEFARIQHATMQESLSERDGLFFMRTGNLRSPRYVQLFWLGDQLTSWDEFDGIKSTVTALLSSGISGYSLNHSDIGGYLSIKVLGQPVFYKRPKELLLRWMELNAFTPVFRTHEGNSAGQQFYSDDETLKHFSTFATIFKMLRPYRERLMVEARDFGYPLVRHLYLHYPNDPQVFNYPYQFLLGKDLLVAPVLDPGVTSMQVYLPQGTWRHMWTGSVQRVEESGALVHVDAAMGRPPVFMRVGSEPDMLLLSVRD